MDIPAILQTISKTLAEHNARAIIVGGAVRDSLLGIEYKDYDVEVYGLESLEVLEGILSRLGSVNLVGKSFGVLKFVYEGEEYDFSFPRTEQKSGKGHRGFDVSVNGALGYEKAARRRDFTINAMGYDIVSGEIIDPFGGREDMRRGVLRHIDDDAFVEDPLRVYRAVQFCARFGYVLAPETKRVCQTMVEQGVLSELPRERVYEEWKKLLLKPPKPSRGFELMRDLGILRHYPELKALIDTPQDPKWHPEGDVWVHTLMALDAMQQQLKMRNEKLEIEEQDRLRYMFAILCHDLGKPETTTIEFDDGEIAKWTNILKNKSVSKETHTRTPHSSLLTPHSINRIRAIGHEKAGIEPTKSLMIRLTNESSFIESILPLVEHHLKPSQFYAGGAKSAAIRRLATKVNIEQLVIVAKADFLGRSTEEALLGEYPAGAWLLTQAMELKVHHKPLENILQGRDLIEIGLHPSPKFKEILDDVYARHLEGELAGKEEALAYVRSRYGED